MSTTDSRTAKIAQIAACPPVLRSAVEGLSSDLLDIYSDHGAHHVGQITDLRTRKGW